MAYLSQPDFNKNDLFYVTDDDIWKVSLNGGLGQRLTNTDYFCRMPIVSPDGQLIAFLSNESGQWDIYLMSTQGGEQKRLTYKGGVFKALHFKNNNTLCFSADFESAHRGEFFLYEFHLENETLKKLNLGPGQFYDSQKGIQFIGRNLGDPARWKGYRGGTAGTFWLKKGKQNFKQILKNLKSNLTNPVIYENRLYFISDHDDIGQIYSTTLEGRNIRQHSFQKEFYVRNFKIKDQKIIYQARGEIFQIDLKLKSDNEIHIPIDTPSDFKQSKERFEPLKSYLRNYDLSPNGSELLLGARGQIAVTTPWSQKIKFYGETQTRYKHATWVTENQFVTVALNENFEEKIVVFDVETGQELSLFENEDWGKIQYFVPHPEKSFLVLSNQRCELWLLDIKTQKKHLIEKNKYFTISKPEWSPDGHYLIYSSKVSASRQGIKLFELLSKKREILIPSLFNDHSPCFDPTGQYLYFIGQREFHPIFNFSVFNADVPIQEKIYVVTLNKNTPSPLSQPLDFEEHKDESKKEDEKEKSKKKKVKVEIHKEGIEQRIEPLNLKLSNYRCLNAIDGKIFYIQGANKAIDPFSEMGEESLDTLNCYCLSTGQVESFDDQAFSYKISHNQEWILIDSENDLRLVSTESKPSEGSAFNRKDGWVNLSNYSLRIDPQWEWQQMYQEAWVLQKENFWLENMEGLNWEDVYFKYLSVLDKVRTRSEFSDLMWEMQGELKTSHAYEFGGDYYRFSSQNKVGKLGAQLKYNEQGHCYEVKKLFQGESWIKELSSPLTQSGVQLNEGDQILSIDGFGFEQESSLDYLLNDKAGKNIFIEVLKKGEKNSQGFDVKAMGSESKLFYRDWVESNKTYVHEKSKGKLGYIHIPNMGIQGYSEFHRNYFVECEHDGLVIDVRYNGGGMVSQLILKYLTQKQIGIDKPRWYEPQSYPLNTVRGSMVCLTNELAGSDGDIFSHAFKLLKLGPLIGKRTWGGVVGIWPRHELIDGGEVTQPEFSTWYKDVGFNVENYGTDPDIEIDILPEHWAKNEDPQLDKAIEVCLKNLKKNPPLSFDSKK